MELSAKFDKDRVWRQGQSVRYLVVRVTDAGERPRGRAALNLALVVDASGSMQGEPLRFAVDAAHRVVDGLTAQDRLSVVSFDTQVTDHVVAQSMTREGRDRAKRLLDTLEAGSCTNLSGGWFRGAEHVARVMESGHPFQNRVIVLSDGHANEGIAEPSALAEHARQLAIRGLITSTVGVGDNYHAETLEAMSVHGGGAHHRAARPNEIVEVVSAELSGMRLTVAEGVTLRIQHPGNVRIRSLNEFPQRTAEGVTTCDLGSLASGASRTAVFRVKFPAGDAGAACQFEARADWKRPGDEDLYSTDSIRMAAVFSNGKENSAQAPNAALAEEVAQVWQAYIVRRIVRLNREGRFAEAVRRVDRDLPLFEKYAKNAVSGKKLVAELRKLREAASRQWSEGNRKEVELVMYKRAHGVADVRSAPPAAEAWSDLLRE